MHRQHLDLAFKLMRMHSNCKDQQDACVILDGNGHVLGTGTIGITGMHTRGKDKTCGCMGYCKSSHAVTRAVAACAAHVKRARIAYCVHAPCPDCINLLHGTPITEIVFAIDDPQSPAGMLWMRHGCTWTHHPYLPQTLKDDDDDQP